MIKNLNKLIRGWNKTFNGFLFTLKVDGKNHISLLTKQITVCAEYDGRVTGWRDQTG